MQNENVNEQNTTTQNIEQLVSHIYYEVGSELLSKPHALCDIVEAQKGASTVVFCNTPSDADLVEAMLRKRGANVRKLIGNAPPMKIHETKMALQNGQLAVLVLTDISARGIELENLSLVVNYALPDDPEVYLHRTAVHLAPSAEFIASGKPVPAKSVASLIAPLDIGNFHYLKKISGIHFSKSELPSAETILAGRIEAIFAQAAAKAVLNDTRYKAAVEILKKSSNLDETLAFLLFNTLEALPNAQASSNRSESRGERSDDAPRREYNDRRGGDRRDDRRDDRRGGRNRRRDDEFSENGNGNYSAQDENSQEGNSQSGDQQYTEGERPRRERRDRDDRRDSPPPIRDHRIYIGHGRKHGITETELKDLVRTTAQLTEEQVKRVLVRDLYSFVDVPDEISDAVTTALEAGALKDGSKVFARKATIITTPSPHAPRVEAEATESEENSAGAESDEQNAAV